MVKKTVTWILVADGAQARLYSNDGPGHGIRPATEWATADRSSRPEGRLVQVCRRPRARS